MKRLFKDVSLLMALNSSVYSSSSHTIVRVRSFSKYFFNVNLIKSILITLEFVFILDDTVKYGLESIGTVNKNKDNKDDNPNNIFILTLMIKTINYFYQLFFLILQ